MRKKEKNYTEQGITLVALLITIIILLILSRSNNEFSARG